MFWAYETTHWQAVLHEFKIYTVINSFYGNFEAHSIYLLYYLYLFVLNIFCNISSPVKGEALNLETKMCCQVMIFLKPHQIKYPHSVWELLYQNGKFERLSVEKFHKNTRGG
jgi:hypothetical protein